MRKQAIIGKNQQMIALEYLGNGITRKRLSNYLKYLKTLKKKIKKNTAGNMRQEEDDQKEQKNQMTY